MSTIAGMYPYGDPGAHDVVVDPVGATAGTDETETDFLHLAVVTAYPADVTLLVCTVCGAAVPQLARFVAAHNRVHTSQTVALNDLAARVAGMTPDWPQRYAGTDLVGSANAPAAPLDVEALRRSDAKLTEITRLLEKP